MLVSAFVIIVLTGFLTAGIFFDWPTDSQRDKAQEPADVGPYVLADISASLERRLQADQRKRQAITHLRAVDGEWS